MAENTKVIDLVQDLPRGNDFANRIDYAMRKSQQTGRPFFVVLLRIQNIEAYAKKHPRYVVLNFYKDLYTKIRRSVHPSQFVGSFQNGFGLVFDSVEVGLVDEIARKLSALAMRVIQEGRYNDLSNRWTQIIHQFLSPQQGPSIMPRTGWAIYPRDGINSNQMIRRAIYHLKELNR